MDINDSLVCLPLLIACIGSGRIVCRLARLVPKIDVNKSIILEAVANQSLWICYTYFCMLGSNNDINVLDRSHLLTICYKLLKMTFILFWMVPLILDIICWLTIFILNGLILYKLFMTHQMKSANILPWCKRLFARMLNVLLLFCNHNGSLLPTFSSNGFEYHDGHYVCLHYFA